MIPVESIIDESTWQAAQDQLNQNYEQAKRNNHINFYLQRGLIRCTRCGGKYSGQAKNGTLRYRCTNYDPSISGSGTRCQSRSFSAAPVEDAIWEAVSGMLKDPGMVNQEMERRLHDSTDATAVAAHVKGLQRSIKRIRQQKDRLMDGYVAGAIELEAFKSRMNGLSAQQDELQNQIEATQRQEEAAIALRTTAQAFEDFTSSITTGIESLTDAERQRLLQLLVEEVQVDGDTVTISKVIEPPAPPTTPGSLRTHHPELDSASPAN